MGEKRKSMALCQLDSAGNPPTSQSTISCKHLTAGFPTTSSSGTTSTNGDLCLNYLDTQGAPLTNLQITTAAALVAKMAGHPADEDRRNLRLAQITQYIEQLYADRFEEWISEDATRLDLSARHALAALAYKKAHLPVSSTFLEAWTELRHAASEDERQCLITTPTAEEISRYPLPEHLPDNNKYAALTYYHLDAQQPRCGTIHNRVSPEMLFCSSSTGEDFDQRSRVLRNHQDIVSGILSESAVSKKPNNP